MIKYIIDAYDSKNADQPTYCLFCGENTISYTSKDVFTDCKHLVFIATSDTMDDPEIDKEKLREDSITVIVDKSTVISSLSAVTSLILV